MRFSSWLFRLPAVLLWVGAFLFLMGCGGQKAETKDEPQEKQSGETVAVQAVQPRPAQAPKPIRPWEDPRYHFRVESDQFMGPPTPPVEAWEKASARDMQKDWVKVEVLPAAEEMGLPVDETDRVLYRTDSVNNAGTAVFQRLVVGDMKRFESKHFPDEPGVLDFLAELGFPEAGKQGYEDFVKRLRDQAAVMSGRVAELVAPIARFDRLFGGFRVVLWSFEYLDKSGQRNKGCFAMTPVNGSWRVIDLGCAFPLFKNPPDVPGAGDVAPAKIQK